MTYSTAVGFIRRWKPLFATDVVYKLMAFLILTPLVAALFRLLVAFSGRTVIADQEILFFFLAPTGWLCLITVGVLWVAITAAELAALLVVLAANDEQHVTATDAIRCVLANLPRISKVIARVLSIVVLAVAPFLATGAITYFMLLTDHDINFYLKEKPPAFMAAVTIGAVISVLVTGIAVHLAANWLFALPVVLFEDVAPAASLRISRQRATGHRVTLTMWIIAWNLVMLALSALATAATLKLGEAFVSSMSGSLALLTVAIGISLVLWVMVQVVINLMSITTFASLLMVLYRSIGGGSAADLSHLNITRSEDSAGFRLTRRRLLALLAGGTIAAAVTGYLMLANVSSNDSVKIIAHRGASSSAPENTMAAVRQAIEEGADWIEIDVQETADGEVVVFHDSDFMKLSGNELKIWDATRADLDQIDIGSWFDASFAGERVPTLTDVLEECRGRAGVVIELKYYGHDEQLEQRVADIVEATEMTEHVMLMSLKLSAVEKMKSLRPDWKVGLLMSVATGNWNKLNADFLAVNGAFVSRSSIGAAHSNGREIYVWTVNDAVTMSTLIGRGVDGLITDKPALAQTVLEARASMSVPERLLLELAETFGVAPDIADQ